jgi:hypothetical protein
VPEAPACSGLSVPAAHRDTARRLFADRGFDRVTVAEVARQAQVAAATVFNYFPTKEDLYSKLEAFEARLLEAIATRAAGEPVLGCGNHRGVGQVLWPLLEEPVLDQPFQRVPPAMPGRGPTDRARGQEHLSAGGAQEVFGDLAAGLGAAHDQDGTVG